MPEKQFLIDPGVYSLLKLVAETGEMDLEEAAEAMGTEPGRARSWAERLEKENLLERNTGAEGEKISFQPQHEQELAEIEKNALEEHDRRKEDIMSDLKDSNYKLIKTKKEDQKEVGETENSEIQEKLFSAMDRLEDEDYHGLNVHLADLRDSTGENLQLPSEEDLHSLRINRKLHEKVSDLGTR